VNSVVHKGEDLAKGIKHLNVIQLKGLLGNQERQSHHHQKRVDSPQQKEKGCEAYHIGALKVCVEASFLVSRINDKDVLLLFRLAKNLFLKYPKGIGARGRERLKRWAGKVARYAGFKPFSGWQNRSSHTRTLPAGSRVT